MPVAHAARPPLRKDWRPSRARALLSVALLLAAASIAPSALAHAGNASELDRISARLRQDPKNARLRLDRVDLYRRMGDLAGAMADLRVVEHQAPRLPRLSFERALVLEALGNHRGAEAELTRHISEKKPLSAAWAARARIREKRKNAAGAIADYTQAIRVGATPDLVLARGKLQTQLGKHSDAARDYREALPKLGGAVVVRLALIEAQRRLGQYEEALEQANALLHSAPDHTDYLLLRADIHEQAKQPTRAKRDREKALAAAKAQLASKDTALSRLSLAKALHALGKAEQAKAELRRVLALSSRLPEALELARAWGMTSRAPD